MKLLIRNLARTTTEAELKTLFEDHCGMPKKGEARAAVKKLNGTEVAGSKIRVKQAVAKPES